MSDAPTPGPGTAGPPPVAELAYADAVAELEAILEGLEGEELDVDHLAERVARAAALIRECRARIASTRFEVERIVTELHPTDAADPPGDEPS